MNCPACGKEMVCEDFGAQVDVCENGCSGIWFDQGELTRLNEADEGLGQLLENALRDPRNNAEQGRGKLVCPKCNIPMHSHKYARANEINIDECYNCGGIFLDSGELTQVRDHYMSDAEVDAYAEKLIHGVPGFDQAEKEQDAEEARVANMQHLTHFLTVNYWQKKF